jgi:Fe(3+) dicitrate transport protein
MKLPFTLHLILLTMCLASQAQNQISPIDTNLLKSFEIIAPNLQSIQFPNDTAGMIILSGKKVEIIEVANQNVSLVTNNSRQVFARIAGVQIWENDGSGSQVSIATRGLNPNRSWEFNVRQNGYDISADAFGYPEAYYNPPMEAVKRIEIIRGAASLQYGPQFGGLLNYEIDEPDGNRKFGFKSSQTLGSFGLFSSYNAIKFQRKKLKINGYFHHRSADGWRQNSKYSIQNAFLKAQYTISRRFTLSAEITRMNYVNQQPGGLTDSTFNSNPSSSTRSRNWFGVPWIVPAFKMNFKIDSSSSVQINVFGLLAERNSVGFTSSINIPDSIIASTGLLNNRKIDRDYYTNLGAEIRYRKNWKWFNKTHFLASGMRYYRNNTRRVKDGKGSNGSDYNLNLEENAVYKSDLNFKTQNAAAFLENNFQIGKQLSITPGIRIESIQQRADGQLTISNNQPVLWNQNPQTRSFILAGVSSEYRFNASSEFYGGISQNFRPILFSDLTPPATTDTIDSNLRDASGYSAELGFRKKNSWLYLDINLFYLYYNDRIGTLTLQSAGVTRQFRTNIGTSVSKGIEYLIEIEPLRLVSEKEHAFKTRIFASGSFQDARYTELPKTSVVNGTTISTKNLKGNKVEYAPDFTLRTGLSLTWKRFSLSSQCSFTSEVFATADNNLVASANAQDGLIPAYTVLDLNLSVELSSTFLLKTGVTNLTDARYFTRRSTGYPGPGILPGEARSIWMALVLNL